MPLGCAVKLYSNNIQAPTAIGPAFSFSVLVAQFRDRDMLRGKHLCVRLENCLVSVMRTSAESSEAVIERVVNSPCLWDNLMRSSRSEPPSDAIKASLEKFVPIMCCALVMVARVMGACVCTCHSSRSSHGQHKCRDQGAPRDEAKPPRTPHALPATHCRVRRYRPVTPAHIIHHRRSLRCFLSPRTRSIERVSSH